MRRQGMFGSWSLVWSMLVLTGLTMGGIAPGALASGLLVPTDRSLPPLRIQDHLVSTTIRDQVAITRLTQTFRNDTDQRLEATYIFPLPEHADLTDFRMSFNGTMVEGEVLPAEEARRIYESIVRQARDPGLIEFIGRRLLRMRVFPVEPKSDTTIEISYQQVCQPISGMRGYHYPLRTPATDGRAFGTLRFEVTLETGESLKNIWSPTHAVEIVREGEHKASIAYESAGGTLEEDFLLLYATDERDLGLSVVAHREKEDQPGHFLLVLTPKQLWPSDSIEPQDVVFVLDTSGSMAGEKIIQARQALAYCLTQLNDADRFAVVRFSTGVDVFREELVAADAAARTEAEKFVRGFTAAGGTNIHDALVRALGFRMKESERPFVVVFLTDGQGSRTPPQIMEQVGKAAGDDPRVRLFPFGVGHDVNTRLLDALAETYRGRPTYVQPGENLELVLGDFFSVISRPVLTQVEIRLPEIGASERFPVSLGDLYHGQQVILAGRFANATTGEVRLSALREGKRVEYVWPKVSFEYEATATYVPRVWAGRKIAFLLDEIRKHGESGEMVQEVVALAQQYGIQTPYTSWLVAPEGRPGRPARAQHFGLPLDPMSPQAEDRLRRIAPSAAAPGGGGGGGFGGRDGGLEEVARMDEAERGMREDAGKAATETARMRQGLRELESMDGARLNEARLAYRTFNERTYRRVGRILSDVAITAETNLVLVRFASDAWFELVTRRPDLRLVLAASRDAAVVLTKETAILVLDQPRTMKDGEPVPDELIDAFSDAQREQMGWIRR